MSVAGKEMQALHRLIYFSRASPLVEASMDQTVRDVLATAIARNREVEVTGALLACDGWFLQALEGSRLNVGRVYGRVCNDRRHGDVKVIEAMPVGARKFAEWSMCGRRLSPLDTAIVETLEMKKGFQPDRLTGPSALNLLGIVRRLQLRDGPDIPA